MCLLLIVSCMTWCRRLLISKSATLFLLELLSLHVSNCNVSFLKPPGAFGCVLVTWYALFCKLFQVFAWNLLTRTIEFLSDLTLSKGHLRILTRFGLTRFAATPSFFYRTAFSMSGNLSMVVENPWQPCFLSCFPKILPQRILGSYSMFLGRADMFIAWYSST
jgi:hypothetical protein